MLGSMVLSAQLAEEAEEEVAGDALAERAAGGDGGGGPGGGGLRAGGGIILQPVCSGRAFARQAAWRFVVPCGRGGASDEAPSACCRLLRLNPDAPSTRRPLFWLQSRPMDRSALRRIGRSSSARPNRQHHGCHGAAGLRSSCADHRPCATAQALDFACSSRRYSSPGARRCRSSSDPNLLIATRE